MPRALITGITGQDGSFLADFLIAKGGYQVFGMARPRSTGFSIDNLTHETQQQMTFVLGDMTDAASMAAVLGQTHPDEIYNLAAMSFVPMSWRMAELTMQTNALGPVALWEAARAICPKARIYQASTSEMFGNTPAPQDEYSPMCPASPYGVAKLAAHRMADVIRQTYGLFISCGILFNHESERRGPNFLTRKVALAVAQIGLGASQGVALGSLESSRDWGFAGDYVEAMWAMLQCDEPDDFVIGTGETHTVAEFVERAFAAVGKDYKDFVYHDQGLMRPTDIRVLRANAAKARKVLGWEPRMTFDDLVRRMVDHELRAAGVEGWR
jgi:GDPmannose 4,6-dehydratase